MGIYIKGMEMPTACGKCKIKNAIKCNRWELVRSVLLDRHRDCPLVPVPPHGSLIEKGALLDKCYQHYEDFMYGKIDGKTALLNIEKEIKAAPNIIEAEEGET